MTANGLHDFFATASTVLPILYIPVVLVYYERSTKRWSARASLPVLLLAMVGFANAEGACLGETVYFAGSNGPKPSNLDTAAVLLVVAIVILGSTIAVAPFSDDLVDDRTRPVNRPTRIPSGVASVAFGVVVVGVSAGPSLWLTRGFGYHPTAVSTTVLVISAVAGIVSAGHDFRRRTKLRKMTEPSAEPAPVVDPPVPTTDVTDESTPQQDRLFELAVELLRDYPNVPHSRRRLEKFAVRYEHFRAAARELNRCDPRP